MANLLRVLLLLMIVGIALTCLTAFGLIDLGYSHIQLAIPAFLYTIFVQAFVMFYFIGVARLCENVYNVLISETNLKELFDTPPEDLTPYLKKTKRYVYQSSVGKRQTIPWTILMLTLGTIGFLLGGAYDTGAVSKVVHTGVIYSFLITMAIGFVRQWYFLGRSHRLLREIKALYAISDDSM